MASTRVWLSEWKVKNKAKTHVSFERNAWAKDIEEIRFEHIGHIPSHDDHLEAEASESEGEYEVLQDDLDVYDPVHESLISIFSSSTEDE